LTKLFKVKLSRLEQPVSPLGYVMKRNYYIRGYRREVEQIDGVLAIHISPESRAQEITSTVGQEQLQVSGEELKVFENAGWAFIEHVKESSSDQRGSSVISDSVTIAGTVFRRPEDGTIMIGTKMLTVKLKADLSEENISNKLQSEKLSIIRRFKFSPNLFEVSVPAEVDPLEVANKLHEDKDFVYAEPVMIEHIAQRFTPTDPEYDKQWQWKNNGIKAEAAWEHASGKNVRVAVIDNAFDVNHEDLKAGIVPESGYFLQQNQSFVQGLTGYPSDSSGHGTFCAGMVGARGNNGSGGCGIAFECELLLIACLQDQVGTQNTLARAIAYAVDPSTEIDNADPSVGADVISCSLGPSKTGIWDMGVALEDAIDFARSQGRNGLGSLIFWATSNANVSISDDQVCSHTKIIAVGRANRSDMADGSAYGIELDFLAPGVDVYSTFPGNKYGYWTGASFATPCAAGTAALLLNLSSDLTNIQVRQILRNTCDKIGGVTYNDGHHEQYGFGTINATKAVLLTLEKKSIALLEPPAEQAEPIAEPKRTYGLVVGIEKYGETAWNEKGGRAVKDALDFTSWLCERGVPTENIWLCLSPLEQNRHLVEQSKVKVESATEQNIFHIITNVLSQQQGDLLYIFWSGYGLTILEREFILICADDTKQNWNSLNLNSLLLLMASDTFGIQKHILIVDGDINYFTKSQRQPTNLTEKKISLRNPRQDSQQFVLLVMREVKQDKTNGKNKTWYFSEAVSKVLEQETTKCWPPKMEIIAETIKQQLKNLDKKEISTYYYCRSWNGDIAIRFS
jgi:subtilisin family serine protease